MGRPPEGSGGSVPYPLFERVRKGSPAFAHSFFIHLRACRTLPAAHPAHTRRTPAMLPTERKDCHTATCLNRNNRPSPRAKMQKKRAHNGEHGLICGKHEADDRKAHQAGYHAPAGLTKRPGQPKKNTTVLPNSISQCGLYKSRCDSHISRRDLYNSRRETDSFSNNRLVSRRKGICGHCARLSLRRTPQPAHNAGQVG